MICQLLAFLYYNMLSVCQQIIPLQNTSLSLVFPSFARTLIALLQIAKILCLIFALRSDVLVTGLVYLIRTSASYDFCHSDFRTLLALSSLMPMREDHLQPEYCIRYLPMIIEGWFPEFVFHLLLLAGWLARGQKSDSHN